MRTQLFLFLLAGAVVSAAAPDWVNEGFEVPRVYRDGQSVVGVEKTTDGAGGWVMEDTIKTPFPEAFLAIARVPEKPEDPKVAREREREERTALKEQEKELDRDTRQKAEEARETAAKAAKVAAGIKTRPGQISLIPHKPGRQSIVRNLIESDPNRSGNWIVRIVRNPISLSNPFESGVAMGKFFPTVEFKDFVRLRIRHSENFSGKIDEIRIGKTLRDVLP